jgi:ribosomal protein L11 methyltransferase
LEAALEELLVGEHRQAGGPRRFVIDRNPHRVEIASNNSGGRGRFLDLGTGTGLLAIAAVKLGFTEVVGIDTDPLAIEGSLRNLSLNNALAVQLIEGTIDDAPGQYDMIAANLIAVTLIERAGAIAARLRPAGVAVLSGILSGQDDEVAEAMGVAGLRCRERLRDGKWVSLACLR